MATVPHPVPSRTTHAIAALYGHDDDTLIAWQRACAQAAETLRPQPDDERLRKALTLAQDGHVTLEDDGFATVESRGKHYQVQADGACDCPDAQHRGATCKHALAVQIHYLASAGLRPGGDHRQAPTAAPSAPSPHASPPPARHSAAGDVHEAPASACFKFRVGHLELLYTLRGVDDAELMQRMTATLPTLQNLMEACEERAEQRAAAREAAQAAQAQQAPANAPTDLPALLQQAVQQALAAQANGQAPSTPPPAAPHGGPARGAARRPWKPPQEAGARGRRVPHLMIDTRPAGTRQAAGAQRAAEPTRRDNRRYRREPDTRSRRAPGAGPRGARRDHAASYPAGS